MAVPSDRETDLPSDPGEVVSEVGEQVTGLADTFVDHLPLMMAALGVFIVGIFVARFVSKQVERVLGRSKADAVVTHLMGRIVNAIVIVLFGLLALAVGGLDVGAALAGLGVAGLALAFALQNILENLVSGVLLSVNKPFVAGEVINTGGHEGIVTKLDLRVTHLQTTDGQLVLIPNADVYRTPLTNITRAGKRRTDIVIGIDYRNDHNAAFEILRNAATNAPGVLPDPEPIVLLDQLGDSGVNFIVRVWSRPSPGEAAEVASNVRAACKTAIEAAGMTIPWPIRTLVLDPKNGALEVRKVDGPTDA